MDSERWQLVQETFEDARALGARERARFLAERCGDDVELRELVTRMLREMTGTTDFLDAPAPGGVSASPLEGSIGPFEIRRELGQGGMGVVYLAHDPALDRDVALKLLSEAPPTTEAMLDRFSREARAVARLEHPGIVPVFQVGDDRGYRWFAMEFLDGGDLNKELQRQRGSGDGAPKLPRPGENGHVPETLRRMARLADALQFAHERGVVHRDLKPHNLLVGEDGELRVVDFGLAKDESQGSITAGQQVGGTPHYMSPEQAAAQSDGVDHRTDIYSLGVVLYEMLTLQRPYSGDSAHEVITAIMHRDPPPLRRVDRHLPRELELVCSTAMARDVEDRYASAAELAEDLRRVVSFRPVRAKRPTVYRRSERFLRRHRGAVVGVLAAVLVAFIALRTGVAMANGRALDDLVARGREALAIASWMDDGDTKWRRRTMDDVEALRARRGDLSSAERDVLDQLEERADALFGELIVAAEADAADSVATESRPADMRGLLRASALFLEAADLFGAEALDRMPDDFWLPPISVRAIDASGASVGGEVTARPLDPMTGLLGAPEDLGALPLSGARLQPGLYRIVVRPVGHMPREFTRRIRANASPIEIACTLSGSGDPAEGMVAIDGGRMFLPGNPTRDFVRYIGQEVEVEPFLVDEMLVSIGDYRAYLETAPEEAFPIGWLYAREQGDDVWAELESGEHDDMPMVGLSIRQARAYAEAQGKRLLTLAEWHYLARWPDDRLRPYSNPEVYRGPPTGPELPDGAGAMARAFLASASTVDSYPEARSEPHGLFHLLGNVSEYIDCHPPTFTRDGDAEPDWDQLLIVGKPWYAAVESKTSRSLSSRDASDEHVTFSTGFRCARSTGD
ncbi:MAG: bifunctional serine/threonine-protein kinase/formylglycine-generating enzyme family protein [Planctomycetota bacterium]